MFGPLWTFTYQTALLSAPRSPCHTLSFARAPTWRVKQAGQCASALLRRRRNTGTCERLAAGC